MCTMSQLLSAGQQEVNVVKQKRSRKRKRDALKEKMLQEWELMDTKNKKRLCLMKAVSWMPLRCLYSAERALEEMVEFLRVCLILGNTFLRTS